MTTFAVETRGSADGIFEPIEQIFARTVGAQRAGGAQLAVYRNGHPVVDLIGGDFSDDQVLQWFSVSKAITSIAIHHAVEHGVLSLDLKLSDVWDEFNRSDRSKAITLEHVLTHSAGLPTVETELSVNDHVAGALEEALEKQEPYWEPGTRYGYHAITWGTLVNGLFRRVTGYDVSEYIKRELANPLGLDLSLGAHEDNLPRVRKFQQRVQAVTPLDREIGNMPEAIFDGAGTQIWADVHAFNRVEVLRQTWPATNVIAGARDVAKLFAATMGPVGGRRLLSPDSLEEMTRLRFRGTDRTLKFPISFGGGVQLPFPQFSMLGPGSFGHEGANGSVAVADPKRGLSVAYVTDQYPTSNGAAEASYVILGALALIVDEYACAEGASV